MERPAAKLYYGWIIVGAGIVITCLGMGTMIVGRRLLAAHVGVAAGSFYAPLTATATRWFVQHRSLAVALISAGFAIGSMTVSPLASWLTTDYGWRFSMFTLGTLSWLLITPAVFLVRRPPALPRATNAVVRASSAEREFTVARSLATPQFAAISFTYFACCAAHSGPIFHMVSYAIDCGVSAMAAATVFGAAGVASLSGRVIGGLAADGIGASR